MADLRHSEPADCAAELLIEHIRLELPEPGSPGEVERLRELLGHARRILATRPVINQAKGILIALEGCTPDEAFELLRRASQRENKPVRVLASELVRITSTGATDVAKL